MFERLRKIFTRSYDGAQGGRRWRGTPSMHAPVNAAHAGRQTLSARARYAVSNNPLAAAAVQAWVAQAIGTGIKPSSRHADQGVREALNTRFTDWTDDSADDGRTDWYGQQSEMFRSMIVTGEALALLITTPAGLRIRILDPDQLDASHTATLISGNRVVQGVEFNATGQRVAYHLLDETPGLDLGIHRQRRRVDAEDVIHLFRQDWPGQVRGVTFFAPAMLRMSDLDQWRDSQLMRQKTAALLTGFVTSTDGSGTPLEGEQNGTALVGGLTPGQLNYLEIGQDVKFSTPANIGAEVIDFAAICEREIAASLGLPAHAFGDVARANYSSLKSANTAWRARCESLQWSVFIHLVCLPVWRRFVTIEVLSGRVSSTVSDCLPVKHITPSWPTLEPLKDVGASVMELNAGLTTRRHLLAQKGEDIEQIDAELAADNARAKTLGLSFSATPANDNTQAEQAA